MAGMESRDDVDSPCCLHAGVGAPCGHAVPYAAASRRLICLACTEHCAVHWHAATRATAVVLILMILMIVVME